jgi:hypothetical protein
MTLLSIVIALGIAVSVMLLLLRCADVDAHGLDGGRR